MFQECYYLLIEAVLVENEEIHLKAHAKLAMFCLVFLELSWNSKRREKTKCRFKKNLRWFSVNG